MAIKQETELYAPLKSFFERQGYDIKGEVRTCDLVGIREDEAQPLIVEMKNRSISPCRCRGLNGCGSALTSTSR